MSSITLTSAAVEALRRALDKRGTPDAMLRLGVRGGGCSGFAYVLQFEDSEPRERDTVFEFDGTRVVCDRKSLVYLSGTTLDWEKTLMHQGFRFVNPHEKSSCGCNESFAV